jgi:hypothetical protein
MLQSVAEDVLFCSVAFKLQKKLLPSLAAIALGIGSLSLRTGLRASIPVI